MKPLILTATSCAVWIGVDVRAASIEWHRSRSDRVPQLDRRRTAAAGDSQLRSSVSAGPNVRAVRSCSAEPDVGGGVRVAIEALVSRTTGDRRTPGGRGHCGDLWNIFASIVNVIQC